MNPHSVTKDFEKALCDYTGAPYAVAVTSCTMALLLALAWFKHKAGRATVLCPKRTYVSVPQSILHAGHTVSFVDVDWEGSYSLPPFPVVDSARRFTSGMYREGQFQCVSFHASKILALEQGGAILHDDPKADAWLRRARFDGRTEGVAPKDDRFDMVGWHCYLSPSVSAQGIMKLSVLPLHNINLENSDYPDLSKFTVFANGRSKAA